QGVLLRRLLGDPQLRGVGVVVLDEFHERSLEADLVLALCARLARGPRPDLRLVVMSATLDAEPVAAFLGGPVGARLPGGASGPGGPGGAGDPGGAGGPGGPGGPGGSGSARPGSADRREACPRLTAEGRRFDVAIEYLEREFEQPFEKMVAAA